MIFIDVIFTEHYYARYNRKQNEDFALVEVIFSLTHSWQSHEMKLKSWLVTPMANSC